MGKAAAKAKVGDEYFRLEIIDNANVYALAASMGWKGEDGVREFCEPDDAADYLVFNSLDAATDAAKAYLAKGTSFYGCAIIDRMVFEAAHDDRGNPVNCPPSWERHEMYEVAMDGERIQVGDA